MGICSLWLFFPLVSQRKLHFEARQVLGKVQKLGHTFCRPLSCEYCQSTPPTGKRASRLSTLLDPHWPSSLAPWYQGFSVPCWPIAVEPILQGSMRGDWVAGTGSVSQGPFRATTHLESLQYRQMIMSTFESRTPWLVVLALDRTAMWLGWPGRSSDGADRPESQPQLFHFLAQ